MFNKLKKVRFFRLTVILPILIALAVPAFPNLTNNTEAATFSVKSGYYVGTGAALSISGLGFTPDLIVIKSTGTAITAIKTKDMATNVVAATNAASNSTGVTIDSGGFTLTTAAAVNAMNVYYYYEAFGGSDCTSSGTLCVGAYSGNGASSRSIDTGFQPGVSIVKSSLGVGAHFRTTSMPVGQSEFFSSTAASTSGAHINSLTSTGFTVGATDNLSGSTFYYIAFKSDSNIMSEGTYIGDGLDDRGISGLGFTPNFVLVKNSTSATANNRRSVFSTPESYGDHSNYFADSVATATNFIQALSSGSFQVGSGVNVNESGSTMYWFALGGTQAANTGTGTFTMQTGVYTGTGSSLPITGVGFRPDLVLIKGSSTRVAIFRTSQMHGDNSNMLYSAASDFAGGITSLDSDGFTVGTNANVNTASETYYWQAFGNAWNSYTNTGAADFAIGVYVGNAADDRNVSGLPFSPSLLVQKRNGGFPGSFRTSEHVGDSSSGYINSADSANLIQSFNSSGFQIGSSSNVNSASSINRWFAFKSGDNFKVGTYVGNGIDGRAISGVGIQPDLVWVKNSGANYAMMRPSNLPGDSSQYMTNFANVSNRIESIGPDGFTVGSAADVNSNLASHRYMAWRIPPTGSLGVNVVDGSGGTVASPSFNLSAQSFPFNCINNSGNYLASTSQRIRITNTTTSPGWALSIGASAGTGAYWQNGGNTQTYDYNDTSGFGCTDGADADSRAGIMTIDPSISNLDAEPGCSSSNITKGSISNFSEGVRDSLTLLTASASAETGCYWDSYNIGLAQTLPAEQAADSYSINLTVTVVAY